MAGGRPRAFDVDEALDRALEVFWRQGYEGTALSDLTAAMGINRPSLYATFGNKQALFRKVLDRYAHGPAAYAARALALPRARDVVEALVYGAIELTTGPDTPLGCINVRTAQACGPDAEPARHEAMTRRAADHAALRRRLRRAQAEGDLPPAPTRAPLPSSSPRSSTASPSRPAAGQAARGYGAPPLSRCAHGQRPIPPMGPNAAIALARLTLRQRLRHHWDRSW
jgi:AcrR family transcriptional regulator